jgi:osmoprotectant transport system permease protein
MSARAAAALGAAGVALLALLALAVPALAAESIVVGSKRFTESYVLGEVLARTATATGAKATHRAGLGNTAIVYAALRAGDIDVYPEYTGTIAREILQRDAGLAPEALNRELAPLGLAVSVPLGFNNTYALAMRADVAAARGIRTISDLARHPDLRFGLTQEFVGRGDGWAGLKQRYGLPQTPGGGLDHGIAYEALAAGRIDVKDVYATDAKIARYGLTVLADDRGYFPRYDAVLLHRADLPQRAPQAWLAIAALAGRIDDAAMLRLNAAVENDGRTFADAAQAFVSGATATGRTRNYFDALFGADFWPLTRQHLLLVFASLVASIAVGVPLGIAAQRFPALGRWILGVVSMVQTVPSLALLALLIAALGMIGTLPALLALTLYALLPIVRNTETGLAGVGQGLRQAALALGLSRGQTLAHVELPIALPTILAGVKTSAVINVGTATIAAFIGAGGYGERIVQGLALNDPRLLVAGALPAAALALLVQWGFDRAERRALARRGRGSGG